MLSNSALPDLVLERDKMLFKKCCARSIDVNVVNLPRHPLMSMVCLVGQISCAAHPQKARRHGKQVEHLFYRPTKIDSSQYKDRHVWRAMPVPGPLKINPDLPTHSCNAFILSVPPTWSLTSLASRSLLVCRRIRVFVFWGPFALLA